MALIRLLKTYPTILLGSWLGLGAALITFALWLMMDSERYGYDTAVIDMPILRLVATLVFAGLIYLLFLRTLIQKSSKLASANQWGLLAVIFLAGLTARLILFASEPMLEDDYQRYLWDGAVTAQGLNPYRVNLQAVDADQAGDQLTQLKQQSGVVFERINYKHLTTIYPPVTQGAFALAHILRPWSLNAWRTVVLAVDLVVLGVLLLLLKNSGRSLLWIALYWWNPLVLKEIFNSSHMDGLLVAFIALAILAAVTQRHVWSTIALACAFGAKFWPAVLLPVFWRPLVGHWKKLTLCIATFVALASLWLIPILSARLDANAGLVAYTASWQLNSPLFTSLETLIWFVLKNMGLSENAWVIADRTAKVIVAVIVSMTAFALSRTRFRTTEDLVARVMLITATLVFFTPAAYPWYTVWFLPFLVIRPHWGLLALTPAMGLYYLRFYFNARGDTETFNGVIAWIIWLPVWSLCLYDVIQQRWFSQRPENAVSSNTA